MLVFYYRPQDGATLRLGPGTLGRATGGGVCGGAAGPDGQDGGTTWGPVQLVYEEGGDRMVTIGNPCPVVDRDTGTIWLPFTRDNDDVFVTSSDDDGLTWAPPRKITDDVKAADWTWYATGPGNGIQLTHPSHRGRLVVPCDHRVGTIADRNQSTRSHVIYSDDHGLTWKRGEATAGAMNECQVVERRDGSLLLNMRSYRGKARRAVATSADGGLTWSPPVDDPTLVEPVCQAGLIRLENEERSGETVLLFSNPASASERARLTVRASFDEGTTWPVDRLVEEGSSAYSCLAQLRDGTIGLLYERDDYRRITLTSFALDWLRRR